ncbi:MAG TPA: FHA domain-containing protein, partial [Stellaceae bacterium]|nr:FHA domain-containing protein [Stellaceae bacterium]
MTLTLSMLRCPDEVAPETRTVAGGEFSIGRGAENDWVLPDPERGLSKRHCVLAFRAGGWQLADLSTNGTFLNREGEPVGRGQVRDLRDGDRLVFGAYEIEVRIAEADPRYAAGAPAAARPAPAPAEFFALDPFAPAPGPMAGPARGDPLLGPAASDNPFAAGPISLPPDFDPLAPDPAASDPF